MYPVRSPSNLIVKYRCPLGLFSSRKVSAGTTHLQMLSFFLVQKKERAFPLCQRARMMKLRLTSEGCKKPPLFPLVGIRREQSQHTEKKFSCLPHMWATWKPMIIKGNHHRRKMARNSTMVPLKWGQKWSGSCSGSERQRKNLLVINCGKTAWKSLEGKEITTFLSSPPV